MEVYEIAVAVSLLSLSSICWVLFHLGKTTRLAHPLMSWPVIGHLGPFIFTKLGTHDYVTSMLAQCGYTAELKGPSFTNLNAILTSDPENIHYILSSKASNFNKGVAFKRIFEIMWGQGIIVAEGESWRFQRRLNVALVKQNGFSEMVERAVRWKMEAGMFPVLDHAAEMKLELDLHDVFQRFTMDVICKLLLRTEVNSLSVGLPEVPLSKGFEDISKAMFARHLKPEIFWRLERWIGVGVEERAKKAEAMINEFLFNEISSKHQKVNKEALKDDSDEGLDMISFFMNVEKDETTLQTPNPKQISYKFLRDSVLNMLAAGRSPTSIALTWFFWLIATHPFALEKLKKELEDAVKPELRFQYINKLPYLHAAILETLRLYPSFPFNHRAAVEADTLPSGHQVTKGMKILISVYSQGRMEEIWGPDCLEFKPERWISDKGEIVQVPSNKFTAFGSGPRLCLGKDLVLMEMKLAIAAIVPNYQFEVVEGQRIVPASSTVLYMKHGFKVRVSKLYRA